MLNHCPRVPLLPALGALALAATLASQTLVIPSANAAVDGNSSTVYPFDVASGRFIYIYDSTHFTGNGVNFPIRISQIAFRANATTATWTGATSSLLMEVSTAPIDYTAISPTWDSNHGGDRATVFNGPFNIPAGSSTAGVPGPFSAIVTFTQPFLYDPAAGDLTLDLTMLGNTLANTPTLDAVTTAGVAKSKRVYSVANPPAAIATLWTGDLANVLRFTYTPATGLYAGFTANVTSGTSPLSVNFTDQSYSSAPAGVTSWAWDFDGDSTIDSTAQNPTFVYANCGTFDVALTVNDGQFPASTLTRPAYIATDLITADFSYAVLVAPNVFQFTDLSSPAATGWAWDLDGDGTIDSTAQNPVASMPYCQAVDVTLNATRNCRTSAVTRPVFVSTNTLSTLFAANNGGSSGWLVMFDASVTNPQGINICGLDHNCGTTALGTSFTVDVYVTDGGHAGKDNNITLWRLVGSGTGRAAGNNVPATTPLSMPVYLPSGNYGIAVHYQGTSVRYSDGPLGPYGNSDVTLSLGSVRSTLFSGGSFFTPRVWNGALRYDTATTGGSAGYGFFAPGCAGSMAVSRLLPSATPAVGSTLSVTLTNLPFNAALMMTGSSNTSSILGPLPFDVTGYGAPGCFLRVSPNANRLLLGAGNSATWNFAIPSSPTLGGLQFFNQAVVIDLGFNAAGAVASDAAGMLIGN